MAKVFCPERCLETDEGSPKHSFKQGDSPRKLREKLCGRERDMEKKTNFCSWMAFSKERGEELKMEVMDPASPRRIHAVSGNGGELLIDGLVASPPATMKLGGSQSVME
jgi:hypothetical protein